MDRTETEVLIESEILFDYLDNLPRFVPERLKPDPHTMLVDIAIAQIQAADDRLDMLERN